MVSEGINAKTIPSNRPMRKHLVSIAFTRPSRDAPWLPVLRGPSVVLETSTFGSLGRHGEAGSAATLIHWDG